MNEGNVASFACGRAHPQIAGATCVRQRHHAGDHHTVVAGAMKTWADAPVKTPQHRDLSAWPSDAGFQARVDEASRTFAQGGVIPPPPRRPWVNPDRPDGTYPAWSADELAKLDEHAETFDLLESPREAMLRELVTRWDALLMRAVLVLVLAGMPPALILLYVHAMRVL
jgi:hypothetical protein